MNADVQKTNRKAELLANTVEHVAIDAYDARRRAQNPQQPTSAPQSPAQAQGAPTDTTLDDAAALAELAEYRALDVRHHSFPIPDLGAIEEDLFDGFSYERHLDPSMNFGQKHLDGDLPTRQLLLEESHWRDLVLPNYRRPSPFTSSLAST